MRDLAMLLAALADPTRLEMLALLHRHDELCVCDFVEVLGVTQSKASRHLRYLWNAGVLEDRRAGLWVYYRISSALGADHKRLLDALGGVFADRDLAELERKLVDWMKRKNVAGRCAVQPAVARRSGASDKVRKPRAAAEARR